MGLAAWVLVPALLALALIAASALRRPILRRLALRNLGRRRSQALAISLGLMVGTAIISGSLATGDSLTFAVRQTALQAFGALDESVSVEGRLYFPENVSDQLARDPRVAAVTDGVAPLLVEDVAVVDPATKLGAPRAALVGLDPGRDRAFGAWRGTDGLDHPLDGLGPDEAVLSQGLADKLDARAGSVVTVRFAERPDLLIPKVFVFNGTLAAAVGLPLPVPGLPVPPPYVGAPPDQASFQVPVEHGARRVTAVLLWGSPEGVDLDVGLQPPSGQATWNSNGTLGSPDSPAILNATAQLGNWTALVGAKAAAEQKFTLIVLVFYEAHDLAALQDFLDQVQQQPSASKLLENVTGHLQLEERNVTVRFVAAEPGRGSFLNVPDVFLRLDTAQAMFQRPGQVDLVMVSNRGDDEQGLARTPEAMQALNASLADIRQAAGNDSAVAGLRAEPLKQEWVDEADKAGQLFGSFLTMMGSFSILAGLILIVNIFVMLAEERKAELGVARALGLRRADLTRMFLYEGSAYAVLAGALGALLGLAVSLGLVLALNNVWSGRIGLALPFHPQADSVALAFGAGVLMTLGAIALAGHRAARLNIVRAIRQLEEPDVPLGRRALIAGGLLTALGVLLGLTGEFTLVVVGPSLAIVGLALLAARRLPRSTAAKLAGAALFAYNLWTIFALETPATTEGMVLGPLRGVLLVVGSVLVLVHAKGLLRAAVRAVGKVDSLRAVARTSLAYPLHRKLRTALTVLMFGLVLTVVVLFSILFAMFTPHLEEQSGGFQVRGESTLPVDDLAQRLQAAQAQEPTLAGVQDVSSLPDAEVWGGRLLTVGGQPVNYRGPPIDEVYGFDEAFARAQDFPVLELAPQYATPRDAYLAALRDPSLAIISLQYSYGSDGRPGGHHVGEALTMKTRAGTLNFTIVAIQKQLYYGGVFVAKPVVEAHFSNLHGLHLVHVRPGADARQVARAMERSQQDVGMDASSVEEDAQQLLQETQRLYALFEVYLGLGLILGIASLGIVTARSVIERRQEVGMLRAIGLPRGLVLRSFLIEGLFVVSLGAGIGLGTGLLVAWGVHEKSLAGLGIPFVVPATDIAAILLVAYAATLLAIAGPARRAARLLPAEAIRYIE